MDDFGLSVSLSSIARRTRPVEHYNRAQMDESLKEELSKVFGRAVDTWDDVITRVTKLKREAENAEAEVNNLKMEIYAHENDSDTNLEEIQQRISDLKYQLKLSKNLLKQTESDYTYAQHRKINIIHGDFKGQVTVTKAEQQGFLMLSSDNQHALDFLARELGIEITPGESNKSDVTKVLSAAVQNIVELETMKENSQNLTKTLERKLREIQKRIETAENHKKDLLNEISRLEEQLSGKCEVISAVPRNFARSDVHELVDAKRVLALMGIEVDEEKTIDELVSMQKRALLKLARKAQQVRSEESFLNSLARIDNSRQIRVIGDVADGISAANQRTHVLFSCNCDRQ